MTAQIEPSGTYYDAAVPDTLDLADNARLALNAVLGNLEPTQYYGVQQCFFYGGRPRWHGLTWNLPAKNARALPWLRTMCGSRSGLDVELALMRTLVEQIDEDTGLAHVPIDNDGAPKGTAYPYANGLLALAAGIWAERDGDPRWRIAAGQLRSGLARIAVTNQDRAYYPPESGYRPSGSWEWTARGEAQIPYRPPEEPVTEQQGLEGCVKYEQAAPIRALVAGLDQGSAAGTRDVLARLVRFLMKPTLWEDRAPPAPSPGNEHGIFAGHFHGNITALHALLDYAVAVGDHGLKQVVREGYDHARRTGIVRMGWYPGWLRPEEHGRPAGLYLASETCGVSDMLLLAVKLSDAGLGDYWDDVDAIVRNHLTAQQVLDLDEMKGLSGSSDEAALTRFVGGFGQSMNGWINSTAPWTFGCCTANGAIGLYYAWHSIIRFVRGTALVNLLLNRVSPWMDVSSHLPHEGLVELHNKTAARVLLRIPSWVDITGVSVRHNGRRIRPVAVGRYLCIDDLRAGDVVRGEFPIAEADETRSVAGREYRIRYRASTVLDVAPRTTDPGTRQYYRRGQLASATAPARSVERFVSDRILPLQ